MTKPQYADFKMKHMVYIISFSSSPPSKIFYQKRKYMLQETDIKLIGLTKDSAYMTRVTVV